MTVLGAGRFIREIAPALIAFGRFLYQRYGGRTDVAVAALKRLEDRWEGYDKELFRIDAELDELRAKARGEA